MGKLYMQDGARPASAARYRVMTKWASGGMADVYVARQQGVGGFDKVVALKFLRDVGDGPEGLYEMFLDEARTSALLSHPCIVHTFDVGAIDDRPYMAMEFVHGETLARLARSVHHARGSFPPEIAAHVARQIADALHYAHGLCDHEGAPLRLVHRDVSPSNILVSFDGGVKLLDFGVARVATQAHSTRAGMVKGKFSYMSPEQVCGMAIDHRSDIFSLGLVMWQTLTGEPAVVGDNLPDVLRQICEAQFDPPSAAGAKSDPELDAIVMRALECDPAARYPTAGALAEALAIYLSRAAPGFDGAGALRDLMTEQFADRRGRLASVLKGNDGVEIGTGSGAFDLMPSSTFTRSSSIAYPTAAACELTGDDDLEIFVTEEPAESPGQTPSRHHRRLWIAVAAAAAAATATAIVAGAIQFSDLSIDVPSTPEPPRVAQRAPAAASQPPPALAREPALAAPTIEPAPVPQPAAAPQPAPPQPAAAPPPRTPIARVRPAPVATRPMRHLPSSVRSAPAAAPAAPPIASAAPRTPAPDAGPPPAPVAAAPAPSAAAPTPAAPQGSLDAVPSIRQVSVDGPLPTSELQSAIERVTDQFRACYRSAARRAGKTPAISVRISFVVDEGRAARNARVTADRLGVSACVRGAISKIRTRVAPDVGTARVVAVVSFAPTR